MDIFANLAIGFNTAFSLSNLLYCLLGVTLGTLLGAVPGIGTLAAVSMLFPLTLHLDLIPALIMLGGIWYGTAYGGSIASILLNIPGTPANAVTCLDGYPMAQQGRAGVALAMTTIASFIGGAIGILLMMFFAPVIATYALRFGSAEYFSLMLLGLVAASTMGEGSAVKGLAMILVGIMLSTVGIDMYSGASRFTFGNYNLLNGISLIALAMGLFGATEIMATVGRVGARTIDMESVRLRALIPTRDDVRRSWLPILRGSAIGSFFGTLPGTGASIASFVSYGVEKRIARQPERFGKGAIEGITSPEAANNAAEQTSFIPTLSLGVPGSPSMALLLGALMIHGVTPGPSLVTANPELFWGLVMSFWIGNVLLVILNLPFVGIWARMLLIPYHVLYPAILVFICLGTYTVHNNPFDIWLVVAFGAVGYLVRTLGFPAAPLLLGFVLGSLVEEHFRRAMLLSRGDFSTFIDRPISAAILALVAALLAYTLWTGLSGRRGGREAAT